MRTECQATFSGRCFPAKLAADDILNHQMDKQWQAVCPAFEHCIQNTVTNLFSHPKSQCLRRDFTNPNFNPPVSFNNMPRKSSALILGRPFGKTCVQRVEDRTAVRQQVRGARRTVVMTCGRFNSGGSVTKSLSWRVISSNPSKTNTTCGGNSQVGLSHVVQQFAQLCVQRSGFHLRFEILKLQLLPRQLQRSMAHDTRYDCRDAGCLI